MPKLILTQDAGRGVTTYFRPATEDGVSFHVETVQDVTHILDANRREANEWRSRARRPNTQEHWEKIADIPEPLYWDLVKGGKEPMGIPKLGEPRDNPKGWKRWLKDPDNRHFLTAPASRI